MKLTMHFENIEKAIAWVFGVFGGCWAFINRPELLQINWSGLADKFFSLAWAATVALVSGAAGVAGKKLIEKFYKRKNKTNGTNHHEN